MHRVSGITFRRARSLALVAVLGFHAALGLAADRTAASPRTVALVAPPSTQLATLDDLAEALRSSPQRAGRPFAIVDKPSATIRVFHADGRLAGTSPVLLGRSYGDTTAPGTGERTAAGRLQESDRTTPAGRFVSEPGRNLNGEAVVWLDYDNALAIHRLRPDAAQTMRQQRLDSASSAERRVSAGCVVSPVAFYEAVIEPVLGHGRAWVVITPENGEHLGWTLQASAL